MDPLLSDLLASVLAQAAGALSPAPRLQVLSPGAEAAWDDGCSQAWVRVIALTPRFPRNSSRCPYGLTVEVAVGVIRCVAVLDDSGTPPSGAQVTADGRQVADDAFALYQALKEFTPAGAELGVLGTWSPLGPSGGAAGGEWGYTAVVTR